MICLDNIDWPLFKQQKSLLVAMSFNDDLPPGEVELLDGIINMLDDIQDEFGPEAKDEPA